MIGGFTAPRGSRTELGALLLGYYDDGQLRYAGKVGTGFDRETLEDLGRAAAGAAPRDLPVRGRTPSASRASRGWTPQLVAEVAFTEWTRAGRLRHPRYLGLREDKSAERWSARHE